MYAASLSAVTLLRCSTSTSTGSTSPRCSIFDAALSYAGTPETPTPGRMDTVCAWLMWRRHWQPDDSWRASATTLWRCTVDRRRHRTFIRSLPMWRLLSIVSIANKYVVKLLAFLLFHRRSHQKSDRHTKYFTILSLTWLTSPIDHSVLGDKQDNFLRFTAVKFRVVLIISFYQFRYANCGIKVLMNDD